MQTQHPNGSDVEPLLQTSAHGRARGSRVGPCPPTRRKRPCTQQLSNWLASEKIPVVTIAQGAARMAAMQSGLKGGGKAKVQKSAGASEVKAGKASSGKAEGKAVKTP